MPLYITLREEGVNNPLWLGYVLAVTVTLLTYHRPLPLTHACREDSLRSLPIPDILRPMHPYTT